MSGRLLVVKFGGSSFLELADYRGVARYLTGLVSDRHSRVVVVVSGMSGTTGRLLEAARAIDAALEPQVQDQVLATAEMVGASFLRAALHAEGCSATDLWAHQIGISSDDTATRARIVAVDPQPLWAALARHRVVVVAGGQAVDPQQRITMLGRNSSDLSAVAVAAALGTDTCEIFSDVPGIYTADPFVVPAAKLLAHVSYAQCAAMSASGAKVLHWGSVAHAEAHRVTIVCRALRPHAPDASVGTAVGVGTGEPAVVGDRRAQLFHIEADDTGPILQGVRHAGLVAASVLHADGTVLAFPGDQTGVSNALRQVGCRAEALAGLGLVSVVEADGRAERRLVALDRVDDEVRALHARLHGNAHGPAAHRPFGMVKHRSAHSDLLSGAASPVRPGPR